MAWEKGQSGNPKGRPPGFKHQEFFNEIIQDHRVDLLELAIEKAKNGNNVMLRFILERFIPKMPMDVKEYEKLELECEKLRAEIVAYKEAPQFIQLLKEDLELKQRVKERIRRQKFTKEVNTNGKINEITVGEAPNTAAEESSPSGD